MTAYCYLEEKGIDAPMCHTEQCTSCAEAYLDGWDWYDQKSIDPNYPVPAIRMIETEAFDCLENLQLMNDFPAFIMR